MGQFTAVDLSFLSDGGRRGGRLYRPEGSHPVPCVVMCSGFGSTMDRLHTWAEVFAAAGLAALAFDYGSFGRSEGDPRQVVDIDGQLADVRAAVACARADRGVDADRVVLWGNSLGGAHAITAAAGDPRIAAVVAQIPFNGFPRRAEGRSTAQSLRLTAAILWDALRGRLGLTPHYIPLVGEPGEIAITNAAAAKEHIRTLSGEDSLWRNQVAPRATLRMMRYRPADAAARLAVPLLVCLATDDAETPVELSSQLAERAPHGTLKLYPGTHFSFYTDPRTRRIVASDQIAFIREALGLAS
ncbi:alpha/beta hydrolase [Micromonospora sp. C28ISP2-4]|uniref:alpha/beta hydrolase n=1 Tax=Micromonospora sp. C28ISP2-4 TaxID=3059523 RepID=UPI002676A76D|nr:alpha/beta fold hydrolase [Micromonospora sp. C28ISP2-4]MDO3685488.1 alpha/beta fold hydrolase [Micromonospora sp. C28ISP2-4]